MTDSVHLGQYGREWRDKLGSEGEEVDWSLPLDLTRKQLAVLLVVAIALCVLVVRSSQPEGNDQEEQDDEDQQQASPEEGVWP